MFQRATSSHLAHRLIAILIFHILTVQTANLLRGVIVFVDSFFGHDLISGFRKHRCFQGNYARNFTLFKKMWDKCSSAIVLWDSDTENPRNANKKYECIAKTVITLWKRRRGNLFVVPYIGRQRGYPMLKKERFVCMYQKFFEM